MKKVHETTTVKNPIAFTRITQENLSKLFASTRSFFLSMCFPGSVFAIQALEALERIAIPEEAEEVTQSVATEYLGVVNAALSNLQTVIPSWNTPITITGKTYQHLTGLAVSVHELMEKADWAKNPELKKAAEAHSSAVQRLATVIQGKNQINPYRLASIVAAVIGAYAIVSQAVANEAAYDMDYDGTPPTE